MSENAMSQEILCHSPDCELRKSCALDAVDCAPAHWSQEAREKCFKLGPKRFDRPEYPDAPYIYCVSFTPRES